MKEVYKMFVIGIGVFLAFVTLMFVIELNSKLDAVSKESDFLMGFWKCSANTTLMAIRERDEVSITTNKKTKIGIYYYNRYDNLISFTFIEENNRQTFSYLISYINSTHIYLTDDKGKTIDCIKRSLIKNNKEVSMQ